MNETMRTTMAFIVPASVKCPKCNYTMHAAAPSHAETFCPKCYSDFLRLHIPVMVPDPSGNPFNPNDQVVTL